MKTKPAAARVKKIVSGAGVKESRARMLYSEIDSGARQQQRLHRIFESNFFKPEFKTTSLIGEAAKFSESKKQAAELRAYARRLAAKRKWALQSFRKWGIGQEHVGKAMERTPSGVSAKTLLCNMTGWHSVLGKVEFVPEKNLFAFKVEPKEFREIVRREQPKTKEAKVFLLERKTTVIITPSLERIRKYFSHERQHAITQNLPIETELYWSRKAGVNPRAFRQGFTPRDLKTGARKLGRELLDELIANMVEGELGFFEKKYKTYYLADDSSYYLGPKTAASFMRNRGKHKERILNAAAESIRVVREALAATTRDQRGRNRKVASRQELAALLANIRDIEKVPKRLPVLIKMRREKIKAGQVKK